MPRFCKLSRVNIQVLRPPALTRNGHESNLTLGKIQHLYVYTCCVHKGLKHIHQKLTSNRNFSHGVAREEFRHGKKAEFSQLRAAEEVSKAGQGVSKVLLHVLKSVDPGDKRGVDFVHRGRFFASQDGGDWHGREGLVVRVHHFPKGSISGIHSWQRTTWKCEGDADTLLDEESRIVPECTST